MFERLYIIARTFHKYRNDPDFSEIIIAIELIFRKYWEDLPMLFPLACVMGPRYNLSGTKYIIDQISNALTFDTPITYRNLEQTLCEMYGLYANRMGTNISRVPSAPTPSAEIEEEDAEIFNLFQGINSYRYDSSAVCSSTTTSMSSPSVSHSHQTSTDSSHNALPAELIDYFNQNMPTDKTIKKGQTK